MFIKAIHSRFENKLYFVENVTIHGRNLNEKLEAQIFKVSKETSKGILKYIMKEF